jgi:predicted amidohydrolase
MRTCLAAALACFLAVPASGQSAERPTDALRMALVNLRSRPSDLPDPAEGRKLLQENLRRHVAFLDRAAAKGADFVGFPELSINGYRFSKDMIWLSIDGPEVQELAAAARRLKLYVSAGLAERDPEGKTWNTQIVLGPDGKLAGRQRKVWLTAEKGHVGAATERQIVEVKGLKMGISICADGSDYGNLKRLADAGAQVIYGPHCNSTGSTIAGWYRFRARWGGPWDGKSMVEAPTSNDGPKAPMPAGGWIASLKVYAALHNHAGRYGPDFDPPADAGRPERWASGAWFIGPDGATLARMPESSKPEDSVEYLLIHDIPLGKRTAK